MHQSVGEHEFEDQDFVSILQHARKMEGVTLAQISEIVQKPELLNKRDKGAAGKLLQTWFKLAANDNRAAPDLEGVRLPDGQIAGVEIKVVPLMPKKGGFGVKERCKITHIDYEQLLNETWETSRARHKLTVVLFIYYHYAGLTAWGQSRVEKIITWMLETATTRTTIQDDWLRTRKYVEAGHAHEISESHGLILGACTTGPGHEASEVDQPRSPIRARLRAFALKPSFLQTTYDRELKPDTFKSITTMTGRQIAGTLQQSILNSLKPHVGLTLEVIAEKLGITIGESKNAAAKLLRRSLGVMDDKVRLLELEEQGVKLKMLPVLEGAMKPLEAMSFPATKLRELADEDWASSDLLERLECLLILPVLAKDRREPKPLRRLGKPFFWSPTPSEWEKIEHEWLLYRDSVRAGKAKARIVHRNGRSFRITDLPKESQTSCIHMRPHGKDASDMDEDTMGNKTPKLSFWLNRPFLQRLLQQSAMETSTSAPR